MKENLLIGTYSTVGIFELEFNNSILKYITQNNSFENCSYICTNSNIIYNIVEYSDNPIYANGCVISRNRNLCPINKTFLNGKGPCYLTIDKQRNMLYTANYGDGSIDIFDLNIDGSISKPIYHKKFFQNSRIHQICFSSDNKIVFITNLGNDTLYAYKILGDKTNFKLLELDKYKFPTGSGPRHLVIKENNLYVITENSCELYQITFSENNSFNFINCVSILPNVQKQDNYTGCAIKISNDGSFIYCSVRGHNSISVFDTNNSLELVQNISCYGNTPRDISFNLSEDFMFCANQNSNDISIFSRNKKTGSLNFENKYSINSPACIINL